MGVLADLTKETQTNTTTMPQWYTQAQQNAVNTAQNALSQAPAPNQTAGKTAVDLASGQNNPFQNAQNLLGQVTSGAATPWLAGVGQEGVQNTSTAANNLQGGLQDLFKSQNEQLGKNLGTVTAGADTSSIGGGGFGSRNAAGAAANAIGNAQTNLAQTQGQQYLNAQNQLAGIGNQQVQNQLAGGNQAANVAQAQGNLAGTQGAAALNAGNWELTSGFTPATQLGNIVAQQNVGNTQTAVKEGSPLSQLGKVGGAAGTLSDALFGSGATQKAIGGVGSAIGNAASGIGGALGGVGNAIGGAARSAGNAVGDLFGGGGSDYSTGDWGLGEGNGLPDGGWDMSDPLEGYDTSGWGDAAEDLGGYDFGDLGDWGLWKEGGHIGGKPKPKMKMKPKAKRQGALGGLK